MYFYRFIRLVLGSLFKLYYNPKFINKENIKVNGPILLCGNHFHLYDQCFPILATKRIINYMAKKEYFDGNFAWFFKATGCISVDRQIKDTTAKNKAMDILNNGGAVGIFPEGTRNKTDSPLLDFKYGTVSMAQKTGAAIVPFAIRGKYKFRSGITVEFGKPFKVLPKDDLKDANEKLYDTIMNLLKTSK